MSEAIRQFGNVFRKLSGVKPSGHGPFHEAEGGWVDPKPYVDVMSDGTFEGYDNTQWMYFGFPEDVKIQWLKNPMDAARNQHFFIDLVDALAVRLNNLSDSEKGDERRNIHLLAVRELYQGIRPHSSHMPAMRDYLNRMSQLYTKPVWFGYMGIQLIPTNGMEEAHGLRAKAERWWEMAKNPEDLPMHLYQADRNDITQLMMDHGFQPLDFADTVGADDYERITAWHGISDDDFNLHRELVNVRMQEPLHGASIITPRWGEITMSAIKPKVKKFMVDPISANARWVDPIFSPGNNAVVLSIRGEVRSPRVTDAMFENKHIVKKGAANRGKKGPRAHTDEEHREMSMLEYARKPAQQGHGMLDNAEIVVGTLVGEERGDNVRLNRALGDYGLTMHPLINRQPIAVNSTFPTYPKPLLPHRRSNRTRPVLSNQMYGGVLAMSGIFRSTRPNCDRGYLVGLSDGGSEYQEIWTDIEGPSKEGETPGFLYTGRPGAGKALALDTPIQTPTGWTTMGQIKVGDQVFDSAGNITRVTMATEVMHNHKVYRVKLSDGQSFLADAEHQWYVSTHSDRHFYKKSEEYAKEANRQKDVIAQRLRMELVNYAHSDTLHLDYVLRLTQMLGRDLPDANVDKLASQQTVDLLEIPRIVPEDGCHLRYPARVLLEALASRAEQDKIILIGDGAVSLMTTDQILEEMINDSVTIPVNLNLSSAITYVKVDSIEEVESVPVRCISVDSPDHSFQIGQGVVTSNTQSMLQHLAQSKYNGYRCFYLNPKPQSSLKPFFDMLGGTTVSINNKFLAENPGCMDPMLFLADRSAVASMLSDAIYIVAELGAEHGAEASEKLGQLNAEISERCRDLNNVCSGDVIFGRPGEVNGGISNEVVRNIISHNMRSSPFWLAFIATGRVDSDLHRQMRGEGSSSGLATLIEWSEGLSLPSNEDIASGRRLSSAQVDSIISANAAFKYATEIVGNNRSGGGIWVDEAWFILQSRDMKLKLTSGLREFRERNIQLGLGTQRLSDFMTKGDSNMGSYFSRFLIMAISPNDPEELDLYFELTGLPRTTENEQYIMNAGAKKIKNGKSSTETERTIPRAYYIDRIYDYEGGLIMGPWPRRELDAGRTDLDAYQAKMQAAAAANGGMLNIMGDLGADFMSDAIANSGDQLTQAMSDQSLSTVDDPMDAQQE